jgi:hypothetical protein
MALGYSGKAFPAVKCFGLNLFVLRDRPILVCLDGVAGLYSRSHTNAVKVATSPRACAPPLGAVLGNSFAGLDRLWTSGS